MHFASAEPASPAAPSPSRAPLTYRRLFDENARWVCRVLVARGVDEAEVEDACQEVFLIAHRAWSERDGGGAEELRAWLAGIARNVARTRRRKRRREAQHLDRAAGLSDLTVSAPVDVNADRRRQVQRCLAEIREEHRDVLLRHYVEGESVPEMMAALGKPEGTVKRWVADGVRDLKRLVVRMGAVVPLFGGERLLDVFKEMPVPSERLASIWRRLEHLPEPGGGGGGGGPSTPRAMPPVPPGAPLALAAVQPLPWGIFLACSAAIVLVGIGILLGRLFAPDVPHRDRPRVEREELRAEPLAVLTASPPVSSPARLAPPEPAPASSASTKATRSSSWPEHDLLDRAAAALAENDAEAALALLDEHDRRWTGGGVLAEWRDRLRIEALSMAGLITEARARAENFAAMHPGVAPPKVPTSRRTP